MSDSYATLLSYVPAFAAWRGGPPADGGPAAERTPAGVLFADISGFTPLTERFAQEGAAGTETLTRVLNAYFGRIIDTVLDEGGDIIKFAGDALIAIWQDPEADLATLAARAAGCGLALQEVLADYPLPAGARLSLKVATGAGTVLLADLGGVQGRRELVIAGPALSELGDAGHEAAPGDVIVAASAWPLLAGAEGEPLAHGHRRLRALSRQEARGPLPRPGAGPEREAALAGYLPGAVLSRLAAGQLTWLAELRQVTVVFVNLTGFNHETPLAEAQALMRAMQTVLYRFEGSVNKLSVDDKGISLLSAFGLPPFAHEDDPERAVQAAMALAAELTRLSVQGSIGIASGRAFCGEIGNERRREYTMIGDVVNLSARLMQAAGGGILADGATARAASAGVQFEALSAIKLKGKAQPVPVFRPIDRRERSDRPAQAALVGREAERRLLEERLEALTAGRGGPLVIEAEAGLGKSVLVGALAELAAARALPVLVGQGDALETGSAYQAWRPILAALLDLPDSAPQEARRQKAAALLADDPALARLAPLLNPVLRLDFPATEASRQLEGQARADATRDLLMRLIARRVAARPMVIVLDDAHWLDSASWALARLVGRRLEGVLLVLALRPLDGAALGDLAALREARGAASLRLAALPPGAIAELISRKLGVARLAPDVLSVIQDRAEGHPFFSEELACALRDAGAIRLADGAAVLVPQDELSALGLPRTVEGVIVSRFDRLPLSHQLSLKVASAIGRLFALRTLREVYPIDADRPQLGAIFAELTRLDFTQLEGGEPEPSYWFKHLITQEVVYDLMLFAQRRQLHAAIARWYEQTHAHDLAAHYPLLAHHWSKAEAAEEAAAYTLYAAEQAVASYANREALAHARAAEAWAERAAGALPSDFAWRLNRARLAACQAIGEFGEAEAAAERLIALAGPDRAAEAQGQWAVVLIRKGQFQRAAEVLDGALATTDAAEPERGWLENYRAECHYRLGEYRQALELAERVRAGLAPASLRARGFVLGIAGLASSHLGDRAGALAAFTEQLDCHEAAGNLYGMAHAHNNLGRLHAQAGEPAEAERHFARGLEIAHRIGDYQLQSMLTNNLGGLRFSQGDLAGARESFLTALEAHRAMQDPNGAGIALCNLGEASLALDDPEAAEAYLQEGVETLVAVGSRGLVGEAYCLLARLKLGRGEAEPAKALLASALELAEETAQPALRQQVEAVIADNPAEFGSKGASGAAVGRPAAGEGC